MPARVTWERLNRLMAKDLHGQGSVLRLEGGPLPDRLAGTLIGRVGASEPFGIGNQEHPLPMPASGVLLLGINDDSLEDNRGEFRVRITQH